MDHRRDYSPSTESDAHLATVCGVSGPEGFVEVQKNDSARTGGFSSLEDLFSTVLLWSQACHFVVSTLDVVRWSQGIPQKQQLLSGSHPSWLSSLDEFQKDIFCFFLSEKY